MAIIRRSEGSAEATRVRSYDPFELMQEFLQMGGAPSESAFRAGEAAYVPAFEVKETKDAYYFKADVPGVKEADLEISLTGNRLTLAGERKAEHKQQDERYYSYEFSYGHFSRSFTLPEGVDGEHVSAELKEGVLTLRAPKKPEVQAKRIALSPASTRYEKAKA